MSARCCVPFPVIAHAILCSYRQLQQFVPEFNKFLADNPIKEVPDRKLGSELLGARLFGRWKSGAPTDISPTQDDPALAADPQRNNNFSFVGEFDDQTKCPFAAHVRKTNPRNDLKQLYVIFSLHSRYVMLVLIRLLLKGSGTRLLRHT